MCSRGLIFFWWKLKETEGKTGKDCFKAKDEHGGAWNNYVLTLIKRERGESSLDPGKNFISNENNPYKTKKASKAWF